MNPESSPFEKLHAMVAAMTDEERESLAHDLNEFLADRLHEEVTGKPSEGERRLMAIAAPGWVGIIWTVVSTLSRIDPNAAMAVVGDFKAIAQDVVDKNGAGLKNDLLKLVGDLAAVLPADQHPHLASFQQQ